MAGKFDSEIKSSMQGGAVPRKAPGTGKPRPFQSGGGKPKQVAPKQAAPPQDPDRAGDMQAQQPQPMQQPMPMQHMGGPPDAHHVNAAAGIAHAILARRQGNAGPSY